MCFPFSSVKSFLNRGALRHRLHSEIEYYAYLPQYPQKFIHDHPSRLLVDTTYRRMIKLITYYLGGTEAFSQRVTATLGSSPSLPLPSTVAVSAVNSCDG